MLYVYVKLVYVYVYVSRILLVCIRACISDLSYRGSAGARVRKADTSKGKCIDRGGV